jgi:hypothetical protein
MTQHYAMLQRNLPYTGITGGKRLVVLGAPEGGLVANRRRRDRSPVFVCQAWTLALVANLAQALVKVIRNKGRREWMDRRSRAHCWIPGRHERRRGNRLGRG